MPHLDSLLLAAQRHLAAKKNFEAEQAARQALAIDPQNPLAVRLLGVALREAGRNQESAEALRQAAGAHPNDAPIHCELGTTLALMGEHREAFRHLRAAAKLFPDMQVAYLNLGAVLYEQGHYEEAIDVNQRALDLKPDCALAHYNQGNALRELGRLPEAIPCFEAALRHQPDFPRACFNLGLTHLLLGNFAEGWPRFEAREAAGEIVFDKYPQPRWDGSPLAGKRLLVHAEQGIGDEILFATCIPDLAPRAPGLVLTCDPRLERLFARSFPGVHVHAHVRQRDCSPAPLAIPCDVQIPAGSLPVLLRPTLQSFPRQSRLLKVDPSLLAAWRQRLSALGTGLKVGISWRAGGRSTERRKRTVPLADWHEMLSLPGVRFVNLQYNDAADDLAQVKEQFGVEIHDWEDADPLVDLDSFAAKIAALDLVISVGNATVHLAGAVGTPAWTMLPMVPSWRWMIAGDENPWYANVRLFRQRALDDWKPVLGHLAELLRQRVGVAAPAAIKNVASVRPHGQHPPSKTGVPPVAARKTARLKADPAEIPEPNHWLPVGDVLGRINDEFFDEPLERARRHREAGEFAEAESLYREILQLAPRQIVAHTGLGLVAMKTGRLELALRSFRRALSLSDDAYDAHYHVAAVLALSGRFEEAVQHYCRVVKLAPKFRPGHLELGLALQRLGRHAEALLPFQHAEALDPQDFDAYLHAGRSLMQLSRIDEARARFQAAALREPQCAAVWEALGESHVQDQEFRQAEECLRRAIALGGESVSAWNHLARMLQAAGRPQEAVEAYEAVLALDPACAEALMNLATVRQGLGNLPAAAALLERAAELCPEEPQIYNALGNVLAHQDRMPEALQRYAQALRIRSDFAPARVNRALALMRQGNLEQAWRDYEFRWQLVDTARPRTFFRQPQWDGNPLAGQTILIHGEQSIGDEILFATCYPDLIEQAGRCIITCSPKLATLFGRAFPQATICPVSRGREQSWAVPKTQIDRQIPAGSLPRYLRSHAASFPRHAQVLRADPVRLAQAKARLAALPLGRRVGIAWQTPGQLSSLLGWQPLLSTPGIQFVDVDLQGSEAEVRAAANRGIALHHLGNWNAGGDLEDLAATIAALDLVIAVDGATLHLAGSLGVATWALCPFAPLGVNWLADGQQRSLWYGNVRIFRPQRLGDWGELARRAREELLNGRDKPADALGMRTILGPHWTAGMPSEQLQ
jgi:tetratricopeptide (TPR) repeat protein